MVEADQRLLLDFLNTIVAGQERLIAPADYEAWLRERRAIEPSTAVSPGDLEAAHRLRGALRSVIRTNACGEAGPDEGVPALNSLNALAETLPLRVRLTGSGDVRLEAAGHGIEGLHARLLAAIFREDLRGRWRRFKLCRNHECERAFFDESRNRSRLWCEMQSCGARAKMRAYRARRAASD